MFGIRALLYLVGIGLVVWILLRLYRKPEVEAGPPQRHVGNMVRCARCGTFLPHGEALQSGDSYYCCVSHRDEDR
jgi:uncharacterized protein